MPFDVINAHHKLIRRGSINAALMWGSTKQKTFQLSATAMNLTCLDHSVWKSCSKDRKDLFVSLDWRSLWSGSILLFVHFRGWTMASSDSSLRICCWHRSHGCLQLGCLWEWRVLGGMLLCRGFLQQVKQHWNVDEASHQHTLTYVHHEMPSVMNRCRLNLTVNNNEATSASKKPTNTQT